MATGLVPVVPLGVKNPDDDLKNVGVGSVTRVALSVNSRTSGSLSGRLYGRSDPAKNEGFAICKQRNTPTVSEGADNGSSVNEKNFLGFLFMATGNSPLGKII